MYVCLCIYRCTYLYMYVCMYACMHVCMYVCMHHVSMMIVCYQDIVKPFLFFCIGSTPNRKVRKSQDDFNIISISVRNKGGFRTGVPKTTFPWKKPGEPSPKTKNKTRLCKGGNRTDPLIHVIMRPPKFSSRNATSPHLHISTLDSLLACLL